MLATQPTYSEDQIVFYLQQNDRSAFNYVYKNYAACLYGIIYKIVDDTHTAEDVLQEVFVKIWSRIDQYDPTKGRICTWMINIARNAAKDTLRSKGEIMKQKMVSDDCISSMKTHEKRIDTIGIKNLVAALRPECRAIIELVYFKGYTIIDVATALYLPEGTVKTRIREAIKTLRGHFHEAYVVA